MRYENDATVGPAGRYNITSAPTALAQRRGAGSYFHLAVDGECEERPVSLRTVRHTNLEREADDEGYRAGRARLTRLPRLLNQVDGVVFPELIDHFEDRNIVEPFHDPSLAEHEPVLVFQHLRGTDLEASVARRYFVASEDRDYPHRIHVPRVARFFRRVTLLAQSLLAGGVAHLDLSPAHVLLSPKDEIPRLLGPGHLAALNDGRIVAGDPALRFTAAGFVAPELVSSVHDWGNEASGEAVMLYGLGASLLAVLLGGSSHLSDRCMREGPDGAISLALELRDVIGADPARYNASRLRYLELVVALLAQDPVQRLAAMSLDKLVVELEALAEGQGAESRVTLRCERCKTTFEGSPERHTFDFFGHSFIMCRAHLSGSIAPVTRVLPCGCTYQERAGDEWARKSRNEAPRRHCTRHRSTRWGAR